MRSILTTILFAVSASSWATPFLVTNPVTGTACTMYMDTVPGVTAPVVVATAPAVGNICQFDLASVAVGSHSVTVTTTSPADPVWGGGGESPKSAALPFVRPSLSGLPPAPSGLHLTP